VEGIFLPRINALWIRFNADPDPAFYINADSDPGSQTSADPAWSDFAIIKNLIIFCVSNMSLILKHA
jgi:hypothetical protein